MPIPVAGLPRLVPLRPGKTLHLFARQMVSWAGCVHLRVPSCPMLAWKNPAATSPPSWRRSGRRSIVLVGMMGAGKSSIGRRLAQRARAFLSSTPTREIEKAAGGASRRSSHDLRRDRISAPASARVIARLLDSGPQVLATGGGAFMNPDTRAVIRRQGYLVLAQGRRRGSVAAGQAAPTIVRCSSRRSGRDASAPDGRTLSGLCRGRRDHPFARRAARAIVDEIVAGLSGCLDRRGAAAGRTGRAMP